MKRTTLILLAAVVVLGIFLATSQSLSYATESLVYSCSNQVFNALEKDKIEAFTKATGIKVDLFTSSSGSATYRLMNGYSDIASTARSLYRRHQDYGYNQIPICKDPLAVIAKKECGVENLTAEQLQNIFSGDIRNWKEVGGADLPILVIVPAKETAANKNFRRQVMKHGEIKFDFIAYDSTMVIDAVKHFPCGAVAFISQGAAAHHATIISITIDGYSPVDADYPYYQTFYYITKGKPDGLVKQFIDFTFSDAGVEIIRKNGMVSLSR